MNDEAIKTRIKVHEGFRNTIYEDSLGKATIGYGHLLTYKDKQFKEGVEYSKEILEELFEQDYENAKNLTYSFLDDNNIQICELGKGIILEMIFQLGIGNVNKFKKFKMALQEQDFVEASNEMVRSKWYSQTPERAKQLSELMRNCTADD